MTIMWEPSKSDITDCQMTKFREYVNEKHTLSLSNYHELYTWSINEIELFWQTFWQWAAPICSQSYDKVILAHEHISETEWFPGSRLNFAENLLRYNDDNIAIIFANELGVQENISYKELHIRVAQAAHFLKMANVKTNDRVAGYLPNCPQAIIFMLATLAIGAIWTSTSPDFGEGGVLDRFSQVQPKILITTDGYLYAGRVVSIVDKVKYIYDKLDSVEQLVVVDYIQESAMLLELPNGTSYAQIMANDDFVELSFAQLPFDHPGFILYSSGTTGLPKTIVHRAGGVLLTHLKEHKLHTDLKRTDVIFYYTTTGWMMWNWLVSALATGAAILCYDGSPFHGSPFHGSQQKENAKYQLWQLADMLNVSVFGTSAKYLASLEEYQVIPKNTYKLANLRTILSTGSILAKHSYDYVYSAIKQDVLLGSIAGGTDIISCFFLCNPVLPVVRGELQAAGLANHVLAFDPNGNAVYDREGELVCIKPFPSMPLGLWHDPGHKKFLKTYFAVYPNVWYHGDYVILHKSGGVEIVGRSDTTLNPHGVRIGSGEIYQAVETIPEIIDSLVVGQAWQNDERVVLFVQLKAGIKLDQELEAKIKSQIKSSCTSRHVPAKIIAIADIPYTINGKKVEIAVKNIINGKSVANTGLLRNPECLSLYQNLIELTS